VKKYWLIIQNTWAESTAYRLNFILWRVRMVLRFLITYFLWSNIYAGGQVIFGYTQESILTYVILVYIVTNFVFATRTQEIGSEIHEGKITNYLLKPISYFKTVASRDVSDKLLNFGFTLFETILLIIILRPPLFFQTQALWLSLSFIAFVCAIMIYFCVSALLSMIGFWSSEVWATRFIFIILLDFVGGSFFPIDILPVALKSILFMTPFPYIFYFPVKLYLGDLPAPFVLQSFGMMLFWTVFLRWMIEKVWQKGLKIYSAEGR
jgi:ABC-2 type transport system permease protein